MDKAKGGKGKIPEYGRTTVVRMSQRVKHLGEQLAAAYRQVANSPHEEKFMRLVEAAIASSAYPEDKAVDKDSLITQLRAELKDAMERHQQEQDKRFETEGKLEELEAKLKDVKEVFYEFRKNSQGKEKSRDWTKAKEILAKLAEILK